MLDKKYETIVLCREDFGDKLEQKIGETLMILMQSGYQTRVYADDLEYGIFVIEFNYKDTGMTDIHLRWMCDKEKTEE